MAYLFIFDLKSNGKERRRVDRYLRGVARKIQHSVWEFRNLPDLIGAAELVRRGGGMAMAFSRKDEILLHVSKAEELLRRAAR
jgi:CRISPR/Cas system-associated endoribonuclease Cas2